MVPNRRYELILAAMLLARPALAADPAAPREPWSLSATAYTDEASSSSGDLSVTLPLPAGFSASGSVGYSRIEQEFRLPGPAATLVQRDVDFFYGGLGLAWRRNGFALSLDGSSWGDKDLARTRDLRLRAGYDWERVSVYASGVLRGVTARLPRVVEGELVREDRSESVTGFGGGIELSVTDTWRVYASGEDQRWDRTFPNILRLRSGGTAGQRLLTTASFYPDWLWSAGSEVDLGLHTLNVEFLADRSIFGALDTRTTSGGWRLPLGGSGDHFLELRVGSSKPDGASSQVFGLLTYTGFY